MQVLLLSAHDHRATVRAPLDSPPQGTVRSGLAPSLGMVRVPWTEPHPMGTVDTPPLPCQAQAL